MEHLLETKTFEEGAVVLDGGPYAYKKEFDHNAVGSHYDMIQASTCLPLGVYTFILYDKKGDGICCDYGRGEYGIDLSKGRMVRPLSSGKFVGAGEVTPFEVTAEDIDILPALLSLPSSVDAIANDGGGSATGAAASDAMVSSTAVEPCATFSMHLVPDQYGNETSWALLRRSGVGNLMQTYHPTVSLYPTISPHPTRPLNDVSGRRSLKEPTTVAKNLRRVQKGLRQQQWDTVLAGGPYSYREDFNNDMASGSHYNAIIATTCLSIGSYKFVLSDEGKDGICCNYGIGEYGINLSSGSVGRVVRPLSAGKFKGPQSVTSFMVTNDDVESLPVVGSTPTQLIHSSNQVEGESPPSADVASTSEALPGSMGFEHPEVHGATYTKEPLVTHFVAPNTVPTTSINALSSLVTLPDAVTTKFSKSFGILFDIETSSSGKLPLVIAGMDMYLDSTNSVHYEVWSKPGSWQDIDATNPQYFKDFRQVSHGTVIGKGSADFTKIPLRDFQSVEIRGSRQAFYVTLSDDDMVFESYEGDGIGRHEMAAAVQASVEGTFQVYYGTAVRDYPLDRADPATDFWNNAGFLGRIWYRKSD
ncbi:hypothetical protein ACHAWF_005867 [Thalassiosira exigua]